MRSLAGSMLSGSHWVYPLVRGTRVHTSSYLASLHETATLARIHAHAGADVVLGGSYLAIGDGPAARIRLDLRLQDAGSGETIASITETGTEAHVFDLVSRAGRGLRERLDIGPLSPAEAGTLRASQPSNPEAARLYAEGLVGPWILFDDDDHVRLHAAFGFGLLTRSLSFGLEVGWLDPTSMIGVRVAFPL